MDKFDKKIKFSGWFFLVSFLVFSLFFLIVRANFVFGVGISVFISALISGILLLNLLMYEVYIKKRKYNKFLFYVLVGIFDIALFVLLGYGIFALFLLSLFIV